jgi:hypothetical protein
MKKFVFTFILAGLAPACAFADVTKEEIRRLLAAGVSEDIILTYVRQHGPVARLSADDLVDLKAAGAGDRILSLLLSSQSVPDADLPYRTYAPEAPSGGVFGTVYVYDPLCRSYLPVRSTRPVAPLCTWGPTFTTVAPRCVAPVVSCRPPVPVCRPVVRSCGYTCR